jgi:hypothetical protein
MSPTILIAKVCKHVAVDKEGKEDEDEDVSKDYFELKGVELKGVVQRSLSSAMVLELTTVVVIARHLSW